MQTNTAILKTLGRRSWSWSLIWYPCDGELQIRGYYMMIEIPLNDLVGEGFLTYKLSSVQKLTSSWKSWKPSQSPLALLKSPRKSRNNPLAPQSPLKLSKQKLPIKDKQSPLNMCNRPPAEWDAIPRNKAIWHSTLNLLQDLKQNITKISWIIAWITPP